MSSRTEGSLSRTSLLSRSFEHIIVRFFLLNRFAGQLINQNHTVIVDLVLVDLVALEQLLLGEVVAAVEHEALLLLLGVGGVGLPLLVDDGDKVNDGHVVEEFADLALDDEHLVHAPLAALHEGARDLLAHRRAAQRRVLGFDELEDHVQRVDLQVVLPRLVLLDARVERLREVEHRHPEDHWLFTLDPVFQHDQSFEEVTPVEAERLHGRLRDVVG